MAVAWPGVRMSANPDLGVEEHHCLWDHRVYGATHVPLGKSDGKGLGRSVQ